MTLLLAARAKTHILLTADGRCIKTDGGVRTTTSDTLQKIFPVEDRPLAIVHHGENILNGHAISQILGTLYHDHSGFLATANSRQLSLLVAQHLDSIVSETLLRIADSKNCGFWVCGVHCESQTPQMYEVIWQKESPTEINFRLIPHGDLLMGGDGHLFIKHYLDQPINDRLSSKRVFAEDLQYSQDLHEELYRQAEDAQQNHETDVFGGEKHQLAITLDGCEWIIPPKHAE